jgi:beta-N-acetylhexosaminidase
VPAVAGVDSLAGQVVVGGFEGKEAAPEVLGRVGRGWLGGLVLFSRNVGTPEEVADLNATLASAAPADQPILLAVDQEGGRVARLKSPLLTLPPMRTLGDIDDPALTDRVGRALGAELGAVGFNLDFTPVVDVDTNPRNPVIGDRAFGRDPRTVMRHAVALLEGLQATGVLACAKHFPGHGDTELDSHLALPRVRHDEKRLRSVELPPFYAAAGAGVASVMTAHVVYDALDPLVPATLSRPIVGGILRGEIGFEGIVFSDDLEMKAIVDGWGIGEAAVASIRAGCDMVLVCRSAERQEEARSAIARAATDDARFRDTLERAVLRSLRVRRLAPPPRRPDPIRIATTIGSERHRAIEAEIAHRAAC